MSVRKSQPKQRVRFGNGSRRTSVILEKPFLTGLKEAAVARNRSCAGLIREIAEQEPVNLSSALRVFVLEFYRNQINQHQRRDEAARPMVVARAKADIADRAR